MISVQTTINGAIDKVWEFWTLPEHIVKWNFPSEDWQTTSAENEVKLQGKFKYTMKEKKGSGGFDFEGIYTDVKVFSLIEYKLFDNRTGSIRFEENNGIVNLTEIFEPNSQDPEDLQRQWCQAVINNFKDYVELNKNNN